MVTRQNYVVTARINQLPFALNQGEQEIAAEREFHERNTGGTACFDNMKLQSFNTGVGQTIEGIYVGTAALAD